MNKLEKALKKMKKAELVKVSRNLIIMSLVVLIGAVAVIGWNVVLTAKLSNARQEYKRDVGVLEAGLEICCEDVLMLQKELKRTRTATSGPVMLITVEKGDTLWDLAGEHLGDNFDWTKIYELNKDKIDDPDLIYPGQVLKIQLDYRST